jgi:putative permease
MKRIAQMTLVVLLTLLGVLLIWQFRNVVLLFVLSLALAGTLRPLVERQVDLGWPRARALLLVYLLTLALVLILGYIVVGPLLDELRRIADSFVLTYDALWANWPSGTDFQRAVVAVLPAPADLYAAITGPRGTAALQTLLGATVNVFDVLSNAAIVVMLSLYWGTDQARFERLWLSILPAEQRARAREIWRAIETGVGAYVRSEMAQSVLAGLLLGVGYWLLGVPYPVLLGVFSAIVWLVPWLGALLALVPVLLAAAMISPLLAVEAGVFTALVFMLLEFGVEPRLYNRRQYSALLVVLMLIIMGETYGALGVLVAPPLAAALQILLTNLLSPASTPAAQPDAEQFVALEERLTAVRAALSASDAEPSPQLLSLVERLEALLDQASAVLAPDAGNRAWVPPKVRTLTETAPAPTNK